MTYTSRAAAASRPEIPSRPVIAYLDCNATTPLEPRVREIVLRYMDEEYGNAGSRTHEFGARAQQAVQRARDQVAAVVDAKREEVIFTSGATEANNLAILGLAPFAEKSGRRHIITSAIEHKAVLEPIEALRARGFDVTIAPVTAGGWVDPAEIRRALRSDTMLVSVMQVNNETGVRQPIGEIAGVLASHDAYLHVDAAQGFGKDLEPLRSHRIDLLSISGHKLYAPKGIGALVARRRGFERTPLSPLMHGGGQERGVRPGTVPVALVAGLGLAAEIAVRDLDRRRAQVIAIRDDLLEHLMPLGPTSNGDQERVLPHVINLSFEGASSEAILVALKTTAAASNGSACTSQSYTSSHVLEAMGRSPAACRSAIRFSWCHLTPGFDAALIADAIRRVR